MEPLHSSTTFFAKRVFPITLLMVPILTIIVFITMEFWIGIIIGFIVFSILLGIVRNFYWNLKYVYLDETNRQLVVEDKKEKVSVKFEDIEYVELVKILSVIIVVKIKSEVTNVDDFSFVPKKYFLFQSPIVTKLNKLIKNGTTANSRLAQ